MKILITESQYHTLNEKLKDINSSQVNVSPLYHFTDELSAIEIMNTDTLEGSRPPDDDILDLDPTLKNTKHHRMISFTRNFNWKPGSTIGQGKLGIEKKQTVVFELDRDKVRTKYRLVPYNYWNTEDKWYEKRAKEEPDFVPNRNPNRGDEYEERALTEKIYPLSNYIVDIKYIGPEFQGVDIKRRIYKYLYGRR